MDLFLSSIGGLVLGTVALLLLVSAALAATRTVVRRLAVAPLRASATGPDEARHLRTPSSDRVTDPRTHPRRPRAPGIA